VHVFANVTQYHSCSAGRLSFSRSIEPVIDLDGERIIEFGNLVRETTEAITRLQQRNLVCGESFKRRAQAFDQFFEAARFAVFITSIRRLRLIPLCAIGARWSRRPLARLSRPFKVRNQEVVGRIDVL